MHKPDILVNKPVYHLEDTDPILVQDFLPELFRAIIHAQMATFVIKPENVISPFVALQENPFYVQLMKDIAKYVRVLEAIKSGSVLQAEWRFFAKPILDQMPTVDWHKWTDTSKLAPSTDTFFSETLRQN